MINRSELDAVAYPQDGHGYPLVLAGGIPLSLTALITGITLGLTSHWGLFRYYIAALGTQIAMLMTATTLSVYSRTATSPWPSRAQRR
ncbi:hypothetical protein [Nonomuraea sp. B19D2]|uniref:hypothetical protein n=1 Tax=Nonomuraea sp. B19D2 TaxID=3159561 RepID=UPI0032DAB737